METSGSLSSSDESLDGFARKRSLSVSECQKCASRECACFKTISRMMPRVGRRLYISGTAGVNNHLILKSRKITHILNLARELQNSTFPDFVVVDHGGLRDAEDEDLLSRLPELVEYIHQVISGGGRIVVNCIAGISRSASVCIAYKVRYEHQSLREAFDEIHKVRPVISPNPKFWRDLMQWEEEIRGENSVVLKPFICGMIPELKVYEDYAKMRIRVGWMEELLAMWTFHLLFFCLQMVSVLWD